MLMLQCSAENLVLPVGTYAKDGRIGIESILLEIALGNQIIVI